MNSKTYYVTFHYTVEVEEKDRVDAEDKAWEKFTTAFTDLSVGDFVSSEPEQQWWSEMEVSQ